MPPFDSSAMIEFRNQDTGFLPAPVRGDFTEKVLFAERQKGLFRGPSGEIRTPVILIPNTNAEFFYSTKQRFRCHLLRQWQLSGMLCSTEFAMFQWCLWSAMWSKSRFPIGLGSGIFLIVA